jgi:arylsulfatase A-like enzyme
MQGRPFRSGYQLAHAEIVDITPTVLYLMGVAVPDDMDGSVLESAFQPGYLDKHRVSYTTTADLVDPILENSDGLAGEAELVQRLVKLGYLG